MEKKTRSSHEILYLSLLLLAAFIWGAAFVAQSIGAEHVGAFTYLALRSWLGAACLVPITLVRKRMSGRKSQGSSGSGRVAIIRAGIVCGTFLFLASAAQQIGIAYTTTAKSSFITALYVVLVPIISLVLGKKPQTKVWFCMALSVIGLYLLCMNGSGGGLTLGDSWTMVCAFLFAMQIISVDHYVAEVDAVRLAQMQFIVVAVISSFCMIFERPTLSSILDALPAILYAGIMSSGVAYTLQIVAQEKIEPTKAAIAMCMESVFGALSGWVILGQALTARELAGCTIMFVSIVLSQVSLPIPGREEGKSEFVDVNDGTIR